VILQARSLAYKHVCRQKVEQTEEEVERRLAFLEARVKSRFLKRTSGEADTGGTQKERRTTLACEDGCVGHP
jgi:hypothetical protein